MARFQIPNLSYIRQSDEKLYNALKSIEGAVNNHSDQGNLDPNGAEQAAPPAISKITATASDGYHDLQIMDNAPAYRGLNYFAYYSKTPGFENAHKIDLGTSQNHRVFLGPGQFYWGANHAYPTSPASAMVYHGGGTPQAVGSGTYAGPEMSTTQGSQAFGPMYRNSSTPPIRK
jgi:hypothetical protein